MNHAEPWWSTEYVPQENKVLVIKSFELPNEILSIFELPSGLFKAK